MNLRARLALTLALLVVPFAFAVGFFELRHHARVAQEAIADQIHSRFGPRERALCEARPDAWPQLGRRRRRRHFGELNVYSTEFTSKNPSAPPFPEHLRRRLSREGVAGQRYHGGFEVAVQMPWRQGPCAIVLLRRTTPLSRRPGDPWFPPLLISLGAVVLAIFAAGPIVSRIQKLTNLVHADADLSEIKGQDEVAELAAAFSSKRTQLKARVAQIEEQDQVLRDYVADTAHDVMVPVTVLQGHLSAFRRASEKGEAVDAARLQEAVEECHYLTGILRNLNVSAKLSAKPGSIEQEPLDLCALVERVAARHQALAEGSGVQLEHAVPDGALEITGDVTLLEQAVGNLVHNAIRYNEKEGHVAVVLDRASEEAGGFVLSVTDDGPGMPEDELAKLKDRGFRGARARTERPSGLGLGLAIASDVAEQHKLALVFERPEEGGLRVVMRGVLGLDKGDLAQA